MNRRKPQRAAHETQEAYREIATRLGNRLGGQDALCRALGCGCNSVRNRWNSPTALRREHFLALEALEARLDYRPEQQQETS